MLTRLLSGVVVAFILSGLVGAPPTAAQWENITSVEGPQGKRTTLTKQPRPLADGLSVRALGIARSDTTQWALSFIGVAPSDTIGLTYGQKESLPITRIERPSDGVGPTRAYVSKETFLTIANTETVTLQVGDLKTSFPSTLRREMSEIARRVP